MCMCVCVCAPGLCTQQPHDHAYIRIFIYKYSTSKIDRFSAVLYIVHTNHAACAFYSIVTWRAARRVQRLTYFPRVTRTLRALSLALASNDAHFCPRMGWAWRDDGRHMLAMGLGRPRNNNYKRCKARSAWNLGVNRNCIYIWFSAAKLSAIRAKLCSLRTGCIKQFYIHNMKLYIEAHCPATM